MTSIHLLAVRLNPSLQVHFEAVEREPPVHMKFSLAPVQVERHPMRV
jgi:hypothetical protein